MKCEDHCEQIPSYVNEALVLILSGLKNSYRYLAVGMLHYQVFKGNFTSVFIMSPLKLSKTSDGHADNRI